MTAMSNAPTPNQALTASDCGMLDRLSPYPDYIDDPNGLALFREAVRRNANRHDMAPVNFNSLARLLDTIARLASPAPAAAGGEVELRVIDREQWTSCSPDWLYAHPGQCGEAPRVAAVIWDGHSHYHPVNWPSAPSKPPEAEVLAGAVEDRLYRATEAVARSPSLSEDAIDELVAASAEARQYLHRLAALSQSAREGES